MNQKMRLDKSLRVTLLLIVFISLLICCAYIIITQQITDTCFRTLDNAADQAVIAVQSCISSNQEQLEAMANLLVQHEPLDSDVVRQHLSAYRQHGIITCVGLLLPSGEMMLPGEAERIPAGTFVFSEERSRVPYVSNGVAVPGTDGQKVFYQAVPVLRDGQTVGILYGFVDLGDFADSLRIAAYDGNVQFFIAEGESGNFLVDTWHHTLGNVYDASMMSRRVKRGYDFLQMKQDFADGQAGRIAFLSNTAGEYFYSSYMPVEINQWMLQVTVLESIVFQDLVCIRWVLLMVASAEALGLCAYLLWVFVRVRRDSEQNNLRLSQTIYMYDVQQTLFDAYKSPELFVTALEKVAQIHAAQAAFFFVLENGAIKESYFSSQDMASRINSVLLRMHFPHAYAQLCAGQSILLYASEEQDEATRASFARFDFTSVMLSPLRDADGVPVGILGCINMQKRWQDCTLLDCVSRNFLMAQSSTVFHRRIRQLSMTDALTGLGNRHRFEQHTEQLASEPPEQLCCLYVDVNGLHDVNNAHGHAAGDTMLQTVSSALCRQFPAESCFRIGGDEFIVLCEGMNRKEMNGHIQTIQACMEQSGYSISIGMAWLDEAGGVQDMLDAAEKCMFEEKRAYYRRSGKTPRKSLG